MWCRLSEIIKLISGQDLQSNQYNDEGKGFLYITGASCIENEKLKKNRWTEYPKSISIKNDILISCKGSIGTIAINTEDKVHIARQIMAIRTNSYCYNLFIKILIKNIIPVIQSKSKGVIPGIERKDILDSLVAIPPLSEQKRIAETVETLLELVDSIESDKIDLSELIKKTKAKVLDLVIKGKLVPQDPNDEPADKLLEKIREEKEKLIKEGKLKRDKNETYIFKNSDDNSYYEQIDGETVCIDDDLPFEIPDSWRWERLQNICTLITDGTHQTPTYTNIGHIFLSSKNVTTNKINWDNVMYISDDLHEKLYSRLAPELNDILLAKNGTIGKAALVDRDVEFDVYVTLAVIRLFKIYVLPQYIHKIIESKHIQDFFKGEQRGIGVPNLHLENIRRTLIPIPPQKEQNKIASKITSIFEQLDIIQEIFNK